MPRISLFALTTFALLSLFSSSLSADDFSEHEVSAKSRMKATALKAIPTKFSRAFDLYEDKGEMPDTNVLRRLGNEAPPKKATRLEGDCLSPNRPELLEKASVLFKNFTDSSGKVSTYLIPALPENIIPLPEFAEKYLPKPLSGRTVGGEWKTLAYHVTPVREDKHFLVKAQVFTMHQEKKNRYGAVDVSEDDRFEVRQAQAEGKDYLVFKQIIQNSVETGEEGRVKQLCVFELPRAHERS